MAANSNFQNEELNQVPSKHNFETRLQNGHSRMP